MTDSQFAAPILTVAAPLLAAFTLPVVTLWGRAAVYPVTIAALGAAFVSAVATARAVVTGGAVEYHLGGWPPPWGIAFRIDTLGALMLLLVTFIPLVVAVYARRSVEAELPEQHTPFYCVYLLLAAGLAGLVSTADLFNLYVFLEITSLAGYALVSLGGGAAVVSAFRYLILGTIGAAFYLLAVAYLYSVTGTLNMTDLSGLLPPLSGSNTVLVSIAFLVTGMALKMGLFPMHAWLPRAYANAPSAVSALIAATTAKVAAYVLIRVLFYVFEPRVAIDVIPATTILAWAAAVAMLVGSVMAIAQSDLKRMLAYSSVAQIGYIILGVGLANMDGFTGAVLHLVNHAFMKGCLFLVAGAIIYRTGVRQIDDLRGLGRAMPLTAATFVLAAFAMIGIPPTGGFFSKLYLLLGAIDASAWVFVAVILISSLLALAYFGNAIRALYFAGAGDGEAGVAGAVAAGSASDPPASMLVPMLVLAAGILLLGLFNGAVVSVFVAPAVPAAFVQ